VNVVGDTTVYAAPAIGYPISTATSGVSNTYTTANIPAAPTSLTASGGNGAAIVLSWQDNATNETNFTVQRSSNGGTTWTTLTTTVPARTGTGLVTYTTSSGTVGTLYTFQVRATNASGASAWSNTVQRQR
jgi:hypothetical protein